ncbi:hypothetical protein ACFCT7_08515 [Fulvivirgaceae bacterium LMO-SS25]
MEHLIIITKSERVRQYIGTPVSVFIPNRSLFELKDAYVIHNHPRGSSFSWEDIKIITQQNAKECFLVTSKYVHHLVRPEEGWNIDVESKEFAELYEACRRIGQETLDKMVTKNEITLGESDVEIIHYIWVSIFSIRNIRYVRKRIEDFQNTIYGC